MTVWTWLLIAAAIGLLAYFVFFFTSTKQDGYLVLDGSQLGSKAFTSQAGLPRSFNEKEGAVYSWTGWVHVKNFAEGFGLRRRIFSKGDSPGFYIDSTSNSFVLVVNTYGSTPETILVSNIPAMKWIHFGIVVDQTAVSIYINGTLRIYHTLTHLPKPNDDKTVFGTGWNGVVGNVRYYPKALSSADMFLKANETPPPDLVKTPSSGSYFDMTWYTGRL
jgi:hypothetical protein